MPHAAPPSSDAATHSSDRRMASPAVMAPVQALVLVLPALTVLAGGWLHRWMNEDAFINLRIVEQVMAGNGPVFNAGERVEAYTSALWLAVLVVVRATLGRVLDIELATVVTGLTFAVAAFATGARTARSLHRDDSGVAIPLGLIIVGALPVVWDFATSGLELSLVWLWMSGCWAALVIAARPRPGGMTTRRRTGSLVLIGLGPLIRPDLGLVMVCVLAGWFLIARSSKRQLAVGLAVSLVVPGAYQVFRMGYFAALVPSPALAKDAGGLHIDQGVRYATDLVSTYWLALPLGLMIAAIALTVRDHVGSVRLAVAAMVCGGFLHASYIIAVGGDYMHGRLLLPALFALALPASFALRPRDVTRYVIAATAIAWAVVCTGWIRYEQKPPVAFGVADIADWRQLMPEPRLDPDEPPTLWPTGRDVAGWYAHGERGVVRLLSRRVVAGDDPNRLVAVFGSIGRPAYNTGIDVWVVDIGGLAEPLAARTSIVPGRAAGHRKHVDDAWYDARFGVRDMERENRPTVEPIVPDARARRAAEHALACPPLSELLDAISEPLSVDRFLRNIGNSIRFTRLHVPSDPREAERAFCGEVAG